MPALRVHIPQVGFEKIIKMMDDMVVLLGKEQKDDEEQKAYCEAEFEKSAKGCT